MDDLNAPFPHKPALMPPRAPLARPIQDLATPFADSNAPGAPKDTSKDREAFIWRLVTFLPTLAMTLGLGATFLNWFQSGGLTGTEIALTVLIMVTFFWIAFSVCTATVGIITFALYRRPKPKQPARPMDVALLIPVYNEKTSDVFGNALAMIEDIKRAPGTAHRYTLFILSDTRDDAIAAQEVQAIAELRAAFPDGPEIYYRRRAENTDHKTGNLADWIENWGGGFEAMLILDADSLMSGAAITQLTDELSADPSAGLIQSFPQIIGARSLYGWIQQFSSNVYGSLLSEGLARWSDREGNFWGHNAILRTQAFAACAGLPRVRSLREAEANILSHDFVEASLLRRAGWAVRFLPRLKGSYEEAPQTLIDFILRDRRWCSGNLQHLRLLRTRGFHAVSRFHLFHGAVAYLTSPAWFALLVFWALLGNGENSILTYFSAENPEFPLWPVMNNENGLYMLLFMYSMLLMPKVMGLISLRATGVTARQMGGRLRFAVSIVTEIALSMAYAPVMMVQQTIAVARVSIGMPTAWVPQRRGTENYPLATIAKFHGIETITGIALTAGIVSGGISVWLSPIAASLLCAIPLSMLSGFDLTRRSWTRAHLGLVTTQPVIKRATAYRAHLDHVLSKPDVKVAAE